MWTSERYLSPLSLTPHRFWQHSRAGLIDQGKGKPALECEHKRAGSTPHLSHGSKGTGEMLPTPHHLWQVEDLVLRSESSRLGSVSWAMALGRVAAQQSRPYWWRHGVAVPEGVKAGEPGLPLAPCGIMWTSAGELTLVVKMGESWWTDQLCNYLGPEAGLWVVPPQDPPHLPIIC